MKLAPRKIILSTFLAVFSNLIAENTDSGVFYRESEAFLSSMPRQLQKNQANAVREAISGNCEALNAVRNSRNTEPEIAEGVARIKINDNLTLFRSAHASDKKIPLLIYLHGGGWAIGSINSCARYCAAMAEKDIAVLAVNYRLAPEHRYPAGLNDCISSVKLALDSIETWNISKVALGGDSSGGNLAIATAMSFPKDTFSSLVLFYPVTKAYDDGSVSWHAYGTGQGLDSALMLAFNDAYTSDTHNPLVSPAMASDKNLEPLPPTILVAADHDILKDQGYEFASRLKQLGIATDYHLIPGSVHLFITVKGQDSAFHRAVSLSSAFISTH